MELRKIDHDHWVWGGHHIRYTNSFGNSGWFWDQKNEGATFGCDVKDDFLEVLDQITSDGHQPKLMPKPAGFDKTHSDQDGKK